MQHEKFIFRCIAAVEDESLMLKKDVFTAQMRH
jgi:hypothetical protein